MSAVWRELEGASGPGFGFREIASRIRTVAERIRAQHQARRRLLQLDGLEDHRLRDMGICRADLSRRASDVREISDRLMLMTARPRHF